jgi:hypothetical protein
MIGQTGLAFNNFIVVAVIVTTLYYLPARSVPMLWRYCSVCAGAVGQAFQRVQVPPCRRGTRCGRHSCRNQSQDDGHGTGQSTGGDLPRYQTAQAKGSHHGTH